MVNAKIKTMTYTDQMFTLFTKGFLPTSPEARELCKSTKHMQSGIHALFSLWKKLGKPDVYPKKPPQESSLSNKTSAGEAVLPGGERVGGIDEVKHPAMPLKPEAPPLEAKEKKEELEGEPAGEEKTEAEKSEGEKAKPGIELATKEDTENTIPEKVVGEGLPIRVAISIKTLALYQYMRAKSGDSLELGDFIDDCVADVFKGRGFDLGLVKLEGGKSGG